MFGFFRHAMNACLPEESYVLPNCFDKARNILGRVCGILPQPFWASKCFPLFFDHILVFVTPIWPFCSEDPASAAVVAVMPLLTPWLDTLDDGAIWTRVRAANVQSFQKRDLSLSLKCSANVLKEPCKCLLYLDENNSYVKFTASWLTSLYSVSFLFAEFDLVLRYLRCSVLLVTQKSNVFDPFTVHLSKSFCFVVYCHLCWCLAYVRSPDFEKEQFSTTRWCFWCN